MTNQISRVVREYVLWTDSVEYSVKGRISEVIAESGNYYQWQVSHNYKPSATSGVYYPSAVIGKTVEEVEGLMLMYMRGFTGIGVEKNERY